MKLSNIYKTAKHPQAGFTLIELMISIVVGLLLLSTVIGIFIAMIRSDSDNLKSIRLNQQLRATMSLIARDLRRAGYNGGAIADVMTAAPNPFQSLAITTNCATYDYDKDRDSTDDGNSESFGFRLNSGAIESRENGEGCTGTTNWDNVTDDDLIEITSFTTSDSPVTTGGITIHEIAITLTGRLINDHNVIRTITETVEVRNADY